MTYYRKRTPIVPAVEWTGDNFDEVKQVCPEAIIDAVGRLWIPSFLNPYCVKTGSFVVRTSIENYPYRAYKKAEFNEVFEPLSTGGE